MMKSTLGLFILAALLIPILSLGVQHNLDELAKWKTECVGRYQVSVPGNVDIAIARFGISAHAGFSDGQPAPFSQLSYLGEISIFSFASGADIIKFKNNNILSQKKMKKELLDSSDEKKKKWGREMKGLKYDTPTLFGWDGEDRYPALNFILSNKIISYSINNYNDATKDLNKKNFNNFLNNFNPRTLHEIPTQPGVCIPYGFIADDGTAPRDIGVTMRLIDHPDVEIFFRDTSGYLTGGTLHSPKDEIEYFWTIMYQKYTKLTEADFWGYRSIKMGGQAGKGMFATIHRYDDSIDYGYIAIVDDIPNTPSQMLYVIRTAARAKGEPISKDELKDIAEKIMSSVKPHPVQ